MEVFGDVRALRHPFGLALVQLLAVVSKFRPDRINLTRYVEQPFNFESSQYHQKERREEV